MIGETLGHYRILERLGAGGMGVVYGAHDERLHRQVALKVLPPHGQSPERLERLRREARALASMSHRNIVTVYSVEEAGGTCFVTMELVRGQSLDRLIPAEGFPIERFFELAVPIAEAVAAAHESGITHRDLKPGNVMLSERGEVKVLDFGLAKRTVAAPADITAGPTEPLSVAGAVVGTVPYMSPEQIDSGEIDHRSDVFSLGVVFYEMLSGRKPFRGNSSAQLISAILRDPPEDLRLVRADVPDGVGAVVARCLAKSREERFQRTAELVEALRALARHEPPAVVHERPTPTFGDAMPSGAGSARLTELRMRLLAARDDRELRRLKAEITAFVTERPTDAEGLLLQEEIANALERQVALARPSSTFRASAPWLRVAAALFLVLGSGALYFGVLRQRGGRSSAPMAAPPEEATATTPTTPSSSEPTAPATSPESTRPNADPSAESSTRPDPLPAAAAPAIRPPVRPSDRTGPVSAPRSGDGFGGPGGKSPVSGSPESVASPRLLGPTAAIDHYRTAWESLDLEAILEVHPTATVTAEELRTYASVEIEIGTCALTTEGDAAVARCPVVQTFTPHPRPEDPEPRRVVTRHSGFRLARGTGGEWIVVELL